VVIGLDPPIRKGQTYYSYLLCQFNNADEIGLELNISDELLAQKNEKVGVGRRLAYNLLRAGSAALPAMFFVGPPAGCAAD
jgi:hypothetical protein